MNCPTCNTINDNQSRFCEQCGRPLKSDPATGGPKTRKPYFYALLLIPVLLLAAGLGYYKYFLPQGIAAVVNGEEIGLAELEAEVLRTVGPQQAADSKLRYQVLNSLITERLVLQEAHKAAVRLSHEELASALTAARTASGQSEAEFDRQTTERYGSRQNFEELFSRRLLVNKFFAEKVVPANADVRTSRLALDRWLKDRSAAASVRITLAEQWSGAGCGCCANKAEAATKPADSGNATLEKTGPSAALSRADIASEAALGYWHQKHGNDTVSTTVTDFGCHMQVDIVKEGRIIGTLRYQAGAISE